MMRLVNESVEALFMFHAIDSLGSNQVTDMHDSGTFDDCINDAIQSYFEIKKKAKGFAIQLLKSVPNNRN